MSTSTGNGSLMRLLMLLMLFICVLQIAIFHVHDLDTTRTHDSKNMMHKKPRLQQGAKKTPIKHANQTSPQNSFKAQNTTDAIVYLAQFKHHSSYGVQYDANHVALTGISKLNKSLDLLYTNYVHHFPSCHVLIFHDAQDVPTDAQRAILSKNRPQVQFRQLDGKWWELPYGLQERDRWRWKRTGFSVGYRHMMRWFAILIWEYLDLEGYTHVMRMDDDSYLHSQIKYNPFDYMRNNNKRYGFRMPVVEDANVPYYIIQDFIRQYPNATSQTQIDVYMKNRMIAFYNNWFIADITFFLSEPASLLLETIDKSKIIYTNRTGDLAIQSTVVRLFLTPKEIEYFRDFTYEHMTLCTREKCMGCPQNGGMARGLGAHTDNQWYYAIGGEVVNRFRDNAKCNVSMRMDFIGADDVGECLRLRSQCGHYMKMLINTSGTRDGL